MSNFERKTYTREEINLMVAEQMQLCVEPICKEIGQVIEGMIKRIVDLETATNSIIEEIKSWKKTSHTVQ